MKRMWNASINDNAKKKCNKKIIISAMQVIPLFYIAKENFNESQCNKSSFMKK